ncbi:hypothetical protein Taro_050132 [Colocasia esculenta]|uniref:Uncharacterized protein n=1 Tax=Colocasia esculenta TaxID=4460 RepID=A0A843XCL9_COLES|nr:hypothetical protein [Colocasia esculenta]
MARPRSERRPRVVRAPHGLPEAEITGNPRRRSHSNSPVPDRASSALSGRNKAFNTLIEIVSKAEAVFKRFKCIPLSDAKRKPKPRVTETIHGIASSMAAAFIIASPSFAVTPDSEPTMQMGSDNRPTLLTLKWRAVVGVASRLGRMSPRKERGEQQALAPQGPTVLPPPPLVDYGVFIQGLAQAPTPVPQEHGHGGPSIMERFKRMAPPSFKGESQPLLA